MKNSLVTVLLAMFAAACTTGSGGGGGNGASSTPTGGGGAPGEVPVASMTVHIPLGAMNLGRDAFGQNPLKVQPGTAVTWINDDTMPHTVTSDAGLFDSHGLDPGQSFTFTFGVAGTFPYHCAIHPGMTGTVVVGGG